MNLQVSPNIRRSRHGSVNHEALRSLRETSSAWKSCIEGFSDEVLQRPSSLDSAKDNICVNGRSLSSYFDANKLDSLMSTLRFATEVIPGCKSLLQDVIGIVALLATMSTDFAFWLKGDNAEESWQKLTSDAALLVKKAKTCYSDHKEIFDSIYSLLCKLIPAEFRFWIQLAARLFVYVWPHRHSIATWIASHWKEIAVGLAIAAGIIGLGAIVIGAIVAAKSQSSSRGKKK